MHNIKISRRAFVGGLVALTTLTACGTDNNNATSEAATITKISTSPAVTGPYATGTYHATIVVKDYGTIKIELYATNVPITVTNFAKLVNEGFYNGLTFHRIIKGFMIQGGDPKHDGTGGSSENIVGEFAQNGHQNPVSHVRGIVSMARSSAPNSASSQFFIMQKDTTSLDGQYAAFGKVISGMEVVDAICDAAKPTDSNGTIPADQQPIMTSITMDD